MDMANKLASGPKAGWINNAVGAQLLGQKRGNVQHPFDRMFFTNTLDLAGQTISFFNVPVGGNYNILNSGGQQITKTAEDTNWDQANQAQYDYLLTGMYFKIQNLTQQSFLASPNDLTTWPDYLKTLLEDSSIAIIVEDVVLTRQKAVHFPEGNAVAGMSNPTGTNATPVSQSVVSNGVPAAANIFGFGSMALWIPKGTRLGVNLKFGASLLAANAVYKPTQATHPIFAEVRFQGVKFQDVV